MTTDEHRGSPVRVLLVEDHPALARALSELLGMDERLIVVACVVFAASFLWVAPVVFVGLPTLVYLTYILSTFGVAITLALVLAAVLAYRTFDEVEKRAARLGDATLLASFFWLGLALIFLYHVMWVVFLVTLVSIWPFQTYTPK